MKRPLILPLLAMGAALGLAPVACAIIDSRAAEDANTTPANNAPAADMNTPDMRQDMEERPDTEAELPGCRELTCGENEACVEVSERGFCAPLFDTPIDLPGSGDDEDSLVMNVHDKTLLSITQASYEDDLNTFTIQRLDLENFGAGVTTVIDEVTPSTQETEERFILTDVALYQPQYLLAGTRRGSGGLTYPAYYWVQEGAGASLALRPLLIPRPAGADAATTTYAEQRLGVPGARVLAHHLGDGEFLLVAPLCMSTEEKDCKVQLLTFEEDMIQSDPPTWRLTPSETQPIFVSQENDDYIRDLVSIQQDADSEGESWLTILGRGTPGGEPAGSPNDDRFLGVLSIDLEYLLENRPGADPDPEMDFTLPEFDGVDSEDIDGASNFVQDSALSSQSPAGSSLPRCEEEARFLGGVQGSQPTLLKMPGNATDFVVVGDASREGDLKSDSVLISTKAGGKSTHQCLPAVSERALTMLLAHAVGTKALDPSRPAVRVLSSHDKDPNGPGTEIIRIAEGAPLWSKEALSTHELTFFKPLGLKFFKAYLVNGTYYFLGQNVVPTNMERADKLTILAIPRAELDRLLE